MIDGYYLISQFKLIYYYCGHKHANQSEDGGKK